MKKHKLSSTFCSFTPCSPLLSFVLSNKATVDQSLCFLQRHPRHLGVILIALLTLVYCAQTHGFDCPRHCDVGLISGIAALSPCSGSRHLAVSITTLQSVSPPCCQPHRLAAHCLTALQSVPTPYSQYRHLAVSLLALMLVTLKSVSQPCNQSHRLAVDFVTLLLAPSPCSC